ncbi:Uncharacterized protein dnm_030570 [Desulfonema magnum]|uniref:Uncharacterized protein n=1 Tax=Desulfonema magnum TaxID=45655 RepID=A0A975GMS9_9BACT|nr:Uncharacterized protein dnm_030570 [Desulfonema magnum]
MPIPKIREMFVNLRFYGLIVRTLIKGFGDLSDFSLADKRKDFRESDRAKIL